MSCDKVTWMTSCSTMGGATTFMRPVRVDKDVVLKSCAEVHVSDRASKREDVEAHTNLIELSLFGIRQHPLAPLPRLILLR